MLPLHTRGKLTSLPTALIYKVLTLEEAVQGKWEYDKLVIDFRNSQFVANNNSLHQLGIAGILMNEAPQASSPIFVLYDLLNQSVIAPGDVIRIRDDGQISILFRRGANANTLFVTERCNSLCLMCSQPPRNENDDWRTEENLLLISLIDPMLQYIGISGGEPTLIGDNLVKIISAICETHLTTTIHALTNGRRFSDVLLAEKMNFSIGRIVWAIPLYADIANKHDYVVQTSGAFDETIHGIYNLAERGHRIEIRFVINAQTVPRMLKFAEFIYRNLPFVEHVAFMGLEPMGFAKVNRNELWIDPVDYAQSLTESVWYLKNRGITTSIYNIPLCVLPKDAWPHARQSISDWKNTYAPECKGCDVIERCSGFFSSADSSWRSKGIKPIKINEAL
jgi:His-Xaa-Ser system radical SAM maturase HxsC